MKQRWLPSSMTARNTSHGKRFVVRTARRKSEPSIVLVDASNSNPPLKQSERKVSSRTQPPSSAVMTSQSADASGLQSDGTTSRRVVVVRNPNNPKVHQGPVDLNGFGEGNSIDIAPAVSDGHKSIYLLRRPIPPPDPMKTVEAAESMDEPQGAVSPTASFQPSRTPTPPKEKVTSPTSPQPRFKTRTPSDDQSPSPSPTKQEEAKYNRRQRNNVSSIIINDTNEPTNTRDESRSDHYRRRRLPKSALRKKSAKSIVFVNPEDQSIVVVENSSVKGESLRPVMMKRPKSTKRARFEDQTPSQKYESTDKLVKTPRSPPRQRRCLDCLSRHMCLIIIICVIVVLLGLGGVGVSAYFLATASTNNLVPKIVGVAVGGALAIAAICFLYILLACIGSRYGYFSNGAADDDEESGDADRARVNKGRAFALIAPTHPNANLYIPRDYMQMAENSHSNSFVTPVATAPYHHQQSAYRSTTPAVRSERKSAKPNIVIEMPERLLTGRKVSPRSRERSLNQVVKNIGPIVEDARKHCNGDMPSKVIVKVDKYAT